MITPDEFRALIQQWSANFPSMNAAAQELQRKLDEERLYQVGVVTATKRVNGVITGISYQEAYNIWSVLR